MMVRAGAEGEGVPTRKPFEHLEATDELHKKTQHVSGILGIHAIEKQDLESPRHVRHESVS
jgi:hypothetical protein